MSLMFINNFKKQSQTSYMPDVQFVYLAIIVLPTRLEFLRFMHL